MDAAALLQSHCAVDRAGDSLYLPGWSLDDWRELLRQAQPVALNSGDVLIRSGDNERALYFVTSGLLEVTDGASRSESLGRLFRESPGSVIGEISLFDGLPRTATVWATVPTQLLRLDLEGLRSFATEHPARGHELLFALGRVLALRLRRGEQRQKRQAFF